jgi:hypothetical protein
MIKICPNCKIKFKSVNQRKIYCSNKCQRVFYRKSPAGKAAARKWNHLNKGWWKEYKKTDVWKKANQRYLKGENSKKRVQRFQKTEKYKKIRKKYHAKEDVMIARKIKNRITNVFRRVKTTKDKTSLKYLGCTIKEFKKYIENKFQPGMNWKNHGVHGWHFDHIRPVASFDLTLSSEKEKCNHFTNFQPLWASENIKKSNKSYYYGGVNV